MDRDRPVSTAGAGSERPERGHGPRVRVPFHKRRGPRYVCAAIVLLSGLFLALPVVRFDDPVSPVLFAADGRLLGARPAADGQWRFPPGESVPERFYEVLVRFEDKRFYAHPGVDPLAAARAVRQNLRSGRIESGASTITMQVVRLARKGRERTFWEKTKEAALALRLEARRSKRAILSLFAAHAPFGGNIVGLDAASRLYFGRAPSRLSWAEAAFLAVLPNDPGLVASAEGRARLLGKRDRLLGRLRAAGTIDDLECRLALAEAMPGRPRPAPREAPHLLDTLAARPGAASPFRSFLDGDLQRAATGIVERHGGRLLERDVRNLAAVVIDNREAERSQRSLYRGHPALRPGRERPRLRAPRRGLRLPLPEAGLPQDLALFRDGPPRPPFCGAAEEGRPVDMIPANTSPRIPLCASAETWPA